MINNALLFLRDIRSQYSFDSPSNILMSIGISTNIDIFSRNFNVTKSLTISPYLIMFIIVFLYVFHSLLF